MVPISAFSFIIDVMDLSSFGAQKKNKNPPQLLYVKLMRLISEKFL